MNTWVHRLSNKDIVNRTATCSNCGEVRLKLIKNKSPRCMRAVNAERKKISKRFPTPPKECEICKKEKRLFIDHDHLTLKFRGWLCAACNQMIGRAHDDEKILSLAVEYLKKKR